MPTINFADPSHVIVNGTDIGHFIDAIRSGSPHAVDLKAAFDVMWADHTEDMRDAVAKHIDALDKIEQDARLQVADYGKQCELAVKKAESRCAELEAHVILLGGEELAAQRAADDIRKQIEAKNAELQELLNPRKVEPIERPAEATAE